jgi:hypothetical protein
MLVQKNHFSESLFGRLFHCKHCKGFPKVIRLIHDKYNDDLLKIEIVYQKNNHCSIAYDVGEEVNNYEHTYEIITCGKCSHPVFTVFSNGGIS